MKIIDASECIMGRLASSVAKTLLKGEEVHIVNAENAVISGSKDMVFGEYISKRNLNHPRKGPYYPRMPHMMLKRISAMVFVVPGCLDKTLINELIIGSNHFSSV